MVAEKKEDKELFFVEVRQPTEVRRNILESLKEILESLQGFEKFKESRKERVIKISKLERDIKILGKHVSRLKGILPEASLREAVVQKPKEEEHAAKKHKHHKKKEEAKKPLTEVDRLESELGAIEEKLRSLQ